MSEKIISQKIKKLQDLLNRHNYLYYVLDKPEISDLQFDQLLKELIDLETKYPQFSDSTSPTKRVGGALLDKFSSVQHNYPMLSLSNTYSQSELEDFDIRVKKYLEVDSVQYTSELKYDGVAVTLIYEKGLFTQAITRGDGYFGDDITENVKTIKSIPLKLFGNFPDFLEIRGEVFINKKAFNKINLDREIQRNQLKLNFVAQTQNKDLSNLDFIKIEKKYNAEIKKHEQFSNARNFASGSLKLLDSSKVASRNLSCIFYSINSPDLLFNNHFDNLNEAKKWGFLISDKIELHNDIKSIMNCINKIELERFDLPYEIDGMVIKVNNLDYQNLLGHTAKSPRWAISYKFQSEKVNTILNSITYQIGRTGAITPVAELNPVNLAGSEIKRASLHNEDFIKNLDLKIGDSVIVEKGGDVIPKVVSVNLHKRTLFCETINFIEHCPYCESVLSRLPNEANHYCLNSKYCIPQKIGQIEHFISRDAMNIHTLGVKTIELLFKESIINNFADLFDLKVEDFLGLQGFGGKSNSSKKAQNIIDSIRQSKNQSFDKVLYSLGIRHVGKTVSKKIVKHFNSIEKIMNATLDQLLEVEEVGQKIANSIFDYFRDNDKILLIERLRNADLILSYSNSHNTSNKLSGLSFVISGTFSISRDDLKALIESNGGKNSTSISKKTNYLIAGNNFGNKKKQAAENLSVQIISELDFKKMLT